MTGVLVRGRFFDRPSPAPQVDLYERYLTDLLAPYALKADDLGAGSGYSYGEMAAALLPGLPPADLLVLAFAGPDLAPGRATATYLSHVCPGKPLAFALTDQGSAAAFTGLRLLAGSPSARSGVLVVVEQPVLHYPPAGPVALPRRAAAVAVHVATPGVEVRQYADVAPDQVATVFPGGDRVILSASLAHSGVRGQPVPDGQPVTGVWAALASRTPEPPAPAASRAPGPAATSASRAPGPAATSASRAPATSVVFADYDPELRYLSVGSIPC